MLSPIRESPSTSLAKENKPSLTVYARQISLQAAEIRSLLGSSITNTAQSWNDLSSNLKETKEVLNANSLMNKSFDSKLGKLNEIVAKQETTLGYLAQSLTALEASGNLRNSIDEVMAKMTTQNLLIHSLVDDQKNTTDALKSFSTSLQILQEQVEKLGNQRHASPVSSGRTVSTKPIRKLDTMQWISSIPAIRNSSSGHVSPADTIDSPLKSQSSKRIRKKKNGTPKNPQGRSFILLSKKKPFPASQALRKRQLSPSLGDPAIEETPQEEIEKIIHADNLAASSPVNTTSIPTNKGSSSSRVHRRKDPLKTPTKNRKKKRRILAGSATQEEWENETTS